MFVSPAILEWTALSRRGQLKTAGGSRSDLLHVSVTGRSERIRRGHRAQLSPAAPGVHWAGCSRAWFSTFTVVRRSTLPHGQDDTTRCGPSFHRQPFREALVLPA